MTGPSRDPGGVFCHPESLEGVHLLAPALWQGEEVRRAHLAPPLWATREELRNMTGGGRTPHDLPAGAEPPASSSAHVFPDSYKLVNILRCSWPLERFWETDPKCFPSSLHFRLKADSSRMAEQWPECRHPTRKYLCPSLACLDCLLIPKQRNSGHLCLHQGLSVCF